MRRLSFLIFGTLAFSSATAERVSLSDISDQLATLLSEGPVQMQYCGTTSSGTSNGVAGGTAGMDALCAAEFAGSRMCTAAEVLDTYYLAPTDETFLGWVRGQFTVAASVSSASLPYFMIEQSTGLAREANATQIENQNCSQFTNSSSSLIGLVFGRSTPSGSARFFYASCSALFNVSCCAPKHVTPVD